MRGCEQEPFRMRVAPVRILSSAFPVDPLPFYHFFSSGRSHSPFALVLLLPSSCATNLLELASCEAIHLPIFPKEMSLNGQGVQLLTEHRQSIEPLWGSKQIAGVIVVRKRFHQILLSLKRFCYGYSNEMRIPIIEQEMIVPVQMRTVLRIILQTVFPEVQSIFWSQSGLRQNYDQGLSVD